MPVDPEVGETLNVNMSCPNILLVDTVANDLSISFGDHDSYLIFILENELICIHATTT